MDPEETELAGQGKLNSLFKRLKSLLSKGQVDPGLVDEIELLAEELKENRRKLTRLSEDKKQKINAIISENQKLYSEIIQLLNLNLEVIDCLKDLFDNKTGAYRVVDGIIIEE